MPIEIVRPSEDSAARERIDAVLMAEAAQAGSPFDDETFTFEARDGETWLGGVMGFMLQGWMCIGLMAVVPEARGSGIGTRLMAEAERLARDKGLVGIWLESFSFQAPGFYARLGFEEVARIPDWPPGQVCVLLGKRMDGQAVSLARNAS